MHSAVVLSIALCLSSFTHVVTGQGEESLIVPRSCPGTYGKGCPNTCTKKNSTCCYCEQCDNSNYGTTQSCSCCPKGFTCCNSYLNKPQNGGSPVCCPEGSYCRSDKTGFICVYEQIAKPTIGNVHCSTCGAFMNFTLTCDNEITEFYYDGVQVPYQSNFGDWTKTDTISIPTTTTVLAAKLSNVIGSPAGLLGSNSDGTLLTGSKWRCTKDPQPSNWMTIGFDASAWPWAAVLFPNVAGYPWYGPISGISSAANWIWFVDGVTFSNASWGTLAYCRLDL